MQHPSAHDGRAVPRLLTVSNRGPVEFSRDEAGNLQAVPGQGGLSTALRTAAQLYPTTWLSSPISEEDRKIAEGGCAPAGLEGSSRFVLTSPESYELFYGCFSNEALWFLQHSLPFPEELTEEALEEAWRDGYVTVNRAFAEAIVDELRRGDYRAVSLHDYHFYLAPLFVRERLRDAYLQHFVHIPWPGPQEWRRLPQAMLRKICLGLLANDSVVFQTDGDVRNFLTTCQSVLPDANVDCQEGTVEGAWGCARVWSNAISADPAELMEAAETQEYSQYRFLLRASPGQKTIIRVDRLDPTKNVIRGFEAYERMLEEHPELHEKVVFLGLLQPTKSSIESYQRYQDDTHRLVDDINRRFGNLHWKPIRMLYEHNRMQALAAMSLYDVLLVNSVADGMNLVAKEGPILNTHEGVLVLSKFAGAHAELACGAIGIDPFDVDETADALYRALTMPVQERRERLRKLKDAIRQHDLRDWFRALLADIEGRTAVPVLPVV
jgi:trehalose 6-phosphate synthase